LQTGGRRWRFHLLVILAYTLLALALTWPLAPDFATHVPGNGVDDPPLTWNLWWVRYALLQEGTNPFDCNYLFYPLGINLAFYTLTVLNGLLSIPLQATLGLIPASNVSLLSSFVLGGFGAYLLASYLLASSNRHQDYEGRRPGGRVVVAAFIAGLLYAFASNKMAYAALGQWNIASSQWIPFYVLYLFKTGDHPGRWRFPLLAALFLLFQAYAELTYASFLILFTALWAIWQGAIYWLGGEPRKLGQLAVALALVALLFAVGIAPILAMMVPDLLAEGDIFVEGSGFADVFSADLLGFLIPTQYHPLLGSLVERFGFDHSVGQHIYLGYSALVLAVVGIVLWWRRRAGSRPDTHEEGRLTARRWIAFWSLSTLVFWLLTLGPSLRVNGHETGIPLPFALVARLPFFAGNRYPSRYSVMLSLSLAMLVAFGIAALLRHRKGEQVVTAISGILVALLVFEHISVPLPLSDMGIPAIYGAIAEEMPGDSTLLDLPVAWRNGFRVTGTQHPIIMFSQYYQSAHGKRLLAGNTSRNPSLKFQYFVEAPVINTLIALETGHQVDSAVIEQDRALAADVLRFFGIQGIVVHPEAGPDMIPYLEATMPVERIGEGDGIAGYRVQLPPWPERWAVTPGDSLSRLSYAEGWGVANDGAIWAQRPATRLLVPLNGEDQQMTFQAYSPGEGQQLELEVNGHAVGQVDMDPGWQAYQVTLPADTVQPGLNEVWLRFKRLFPASDVKLSSRKIGQTGVESPANLVVYSAGNEVGDVGHIYVNGQDVSPNARGYNVAVLHPQSAEVEQVAAFDTHLDEGGSQALARFLDGVPAGRIVAVSAADEASRLLGPEAVASLGRIGATGDLQDKFRWGHAILGVQGASPGTALEGLDWMRPVTLVAGDGTTEPELAAAFGPIDFAAAPGR